MLDLTNFEQTTEYVNESFQEYAKARVASDKGMQLFGVKNIDFKTEIVQLYEGLRGIRRVAEGQDLPKAQGREGDNITFIQSQYGVNVPVTKDMRIFQRFEAVSSLLKTQTDEAFDLIDQSLADVLTNGWLTSYQDAYGDVVSGVGPDGKALFSATHTSSAFADYSFKNIINDGSVDNPTLSRTAVVKTRSKGLKYKDPAGVTRPVHLDTLVVGPDLEDLANRIVKSEGIVGTANLETNSYLSSMKIVVWERLGSTSTGTDTSAYWFMVDSSRVKDGLRAYFKQKPQMASPNAYGPNQVWNYELDYFYDRGFVSPVAVYGSKGTNS